MTTVTQFKRRSTRRRKPPASTHSMRVPDAIWERAAARAYSEGRSMNEVLGTFVEWYADGRLGFGQRPPILSQESDD